MSRSVRLRRHVALWVAIAVVTVLGGCGSNKDSGTVVKDAGPACAKVAKLTKSKGKPTKVEVPKAPVTKLVSDDLKPGTGAAAAEGKQLTVNYVGISCTSGQEFDSSWGKKGKNKDDPLEFVLGTGKVIKEWDRGLVGMKVNGERRLVIPGDLAYGLAGQPPRIANNDTLVFLVELLKVENAPPTTTTTTATTTPAKPGSTTTPAKPGSTTTSRSSTTSRSTTTTSRTTTTSEP